jgi:hypothetical protein
MTPAKEKQHEPTAVKREMTEKITEPGKTHKPTLKKLQKKLDGVA